MTTTATTMTTREILDQLKSLGSDSYKKVLLNHGIKEPFFGVKVGELKKIQKRVKKDHQLALELYDTGNYDAQYLAGLLADETKITKKDLARWLAKSNCGAICGSIVSWLAAESAHGRDLALEWIESSKEYTAEAGWVTLSLWVALKDDDELDHDELKQLLKRVERTIHEQPNHARYGMNGFVIAVGTYVPALTKLATQTAERIGEVSVDMGNTSCEVPYAPDYIAKAQKRGVIGKKRKSARC